MNFYRRILSTYLVSSPDLYEEIRRHALDGSKAAVTRNFVTIEEGREVAFVSLDIFPPSRQPLVLYTLAVLTFQVWKV